MPEHQPVDILLVEDNPADVRLVKEVFSGSRWAPRIHVAEDGEAALAALRKRGGPRIRLIILDLNLPRLDGRAFLDLLKNDERIRAIPVIVLTTSRAENDIQESYHRHASAYLAKPVDFEEFEAAMRALAAFWLDHAELPKGAPS